MARFLLLLSPEHRCQDLLSAAELGRRTSELVAWVAELRRAGVIRSGARLEPHTQRVTLEGGAARVSADGGATVGLYFVVEVADWRDALELAAGCPGIAPGSIDVFACDAEAALATGAPP